MAKKIKETEYEVAIQDTNPGSKTPTTTSKVTAASADQAISTATGGQPTTDAEVVTVRKKSPTGAPSQPSQGVVSNTMETYKRPTMKAITEGVNYPYSITLPMPFKKFLESNNFVYTEVGNSTMVRFNNKGSLVECLRALNKSTDPISDVIFDGIGRSI